MQEDKINQWSQSFVWLWFNDEEIFHFTQEDFDRKAKELHDHGVTMAITFGLTHFRLGFYPYWKQINDAIEKICIACHKYGIRVVEHHSAQLTHNLLSSAGWKRLEDDMEVFGHGKSRLENWEKVPIFMADDPHIYGKRMRDWFQIDGSTGKPAGNVYGCYCMCYNNPDYREAYFTYLKDVVSRGIDGIMNDDVQYFGYGRACTCEHCRKKFKEQTGYDIPQPEDWDSFFEHYDNPAFIAWKRFRRESTREFYIALTRLYEELGVKLIRPNYCSDILKHNPTAYSFDQCCELWDFIFQENCFSAVMKASWPEFMAEAVHRYAKGQRHGVPSMSMFYPDREDNAYFGWALARSWGQLYTGTCEGFDISGIEAKYRAFEKEHIGYLADPKKCADVAFYFSMSTRDYTDKALERYMLPFIGGMQAAYVSGLGVDMVFEEDSLEELKGHGCIVASHVAMMADEELARLRAYVQDGGKLVILGEFAAFEPDGSVRSSAKAAELLGLAARPVAGEYRGRARVSAGSASELPAVRALMRFDRGEAACTADDGSVIGIREKLGAGEVYWFALDMAESEFQETIWSPRRQAHPPRVPAQPSLVPTQRSGTGALLRAVCPAPKMSVECEKDLVIGSCFAVESGLALHLINLSNTLPAGPEEIGHEDVIEDFAPGAEKLCELRIRVKREPGAAAVRSATLFTPERPEGVALAFTDQGGELLCSVPAGTFSGYALIEVLG